MSIDTLLKEQRTLHASDVFKESSNFKDGSIYQEADKNWLAFWERQAENLHWSKKWTKTMSWDKPYAKWFYDGELNASFNCLDIHIGTETEQKTALVWEGETGKIKTLSYRALFVEVNRMASILKHQYGIQKGDRVTLYMPMIPQLAISVLACARIGAIHSVVFAGFSANSLKDRIEDSQSKLVITADGGYRRGKVLDLKSIVDEAIEDDQTPVKNVLYFKHIGGTFKVSEKKGRDTEYSKLLPKAQSYIAPEAMNSEDTLFILYTSGTTGKPKGIKHATGGYMTHAKYSTKTVFDLNNDDVFWCTADIGWITGHTYVIYGPLSNGATIVMYEGSPDYPAKDRFWEIVERHAVSVLYTAPTAVRSFMCWGEQEPQKHDLSSLRLLGSVGEPINPEAWEWYHEHIGQKKCPIVDTWWQTETGGILISNIPAINPMKPGSAGLALPGIEAKVLDENGKEVTEGGGLLSITRPWPSMLRGIWGDDKRYQETYWNRFDTYFAGDSAKIDQDGYFTVLGRVDDVLNVSGHRIGTMEVESAVVEFEGVAEAAVVGMPDEIKGQAILAFVILKEGVQKTDTLEKEVIRFVGEQIGGIAKPKRVIFTPELPKTRSGKIMRRLLKDLAAGQEIGETTTLANPDIMEKLARDLSL